MKEVKMHHIKKEEKTMNRTIITVCFFFLSLVIGADPWAADELATKKECVTMCKKASDLIANLGKEAALKQLNDKDGPFVWKDSYVFVLDSDAAVLVAHPIKPHLVGKNLIGIKDTNGKLFFLEFTNIANSEEGEGWVDYMWPKPGKRKASPKRSYILKVPGMQLAVGAGIYE
jgi:signal transduction histidine kinase